MKLHFKELNFNPGLAATSFVVDTTRNDPQFFSHATWNDPRGIIGVEWENISISGIRLERFNSVFRLMQNAKFFGYKREIFFEWLIDCTKLFSVILIAWNLLFP